MTITIQLNSPKTIDEYEPLVAIYNQVWSDHPGTVNEWQHNDKQWPDTHLFQRFIVHFDDALVAEGAITESRWAHVPGKYGFGYSLPPAYEAIESDGRTIQDAIYDFVLDYLAEHNPIALQSWTREDKTVYMDWLAANGFQQTMRYAESALDVPSFDSSRFDGVREGVAKSGIEILQLSDLQSRDPDWACKKHTICALKSSTIFLHLIRRLRSHLNSLRRVSPTPIFSRMAGLSPWTRPLSKKGTTWV